MCVCAKRSFHPVVTRSIPTTLSLCMCMCVCCLVFAIGARCAMCDAIVWLPSFVDVVNASHHRSKRLDRESLSTYTVLTTRAAKVPGTARERSHVMHISAFVCLLNTMCIHTNAHNIILVLLVKHIHTHTQTHLSIFFSRIYRLAVRTWRAWKGTRWRSLRTQFLRLLYAGYCVALFHIVGIL